ncbi:MAG TPA: clostripain-related cysteine peptidase, partial [Pyrinomonadaceae bacterium]|nr:clostripain-related cysteine peptidase [Pyrinomonadaceae bacterium]
KRFPADNTLAVIWGHGSGFRGARRDIADDAYGLSLDIPEIEDSLRRARLERPNQSKLTILGFDACLMNMLEVVHHLRHEAEIIVGSQQTEPGDGWRYDHVLSAIKASDSAEDLARQIVNLYIADCERQGRLNVTQSAVITGNTGEAIAALGELGNELAALLKNADTGQTTREEMMRLRRNAQSFAYADYVDLIDFARRLGPVGLSPNIEALSTRVIESARRCLIPEAVGRFGEGVADANGISIWFPSDALFYGIYRQKYVNLNFVKTSTGWLGFLDALFSVSR